MVVVAPDNVVVPPTARLAPAPMVIPVPSIVTFWVAGTAPFTVKPVMLVCAPAQVLVLSTSKESVPVVPLPVTHNVLRTPAAGPVGVVTDCALASLSTN